MISSNILAGLNPQQLQAVTLPHQSALILAGAGSGKTRVLTTRIVWLIQTGQVSPHGLLAVTFTNKAAREMLTRISAMLPINTRGMWVGTFHGLCNRMLRAHYRDAGLPQTFQILDTQDQLALIKRLLKSLNVDEEKYPPRDLQYFISGHKEAGRRASAVEAYDEHSKRLIELYAQYDQQCNREGVVDFAELLLRCFELLTRHEILREHYRRRFSHILVDEFQDTNRLQYLWLKLLAGADNAIFAVGDDDQSIYAFRGASSQNMFEFEREFAQSRVIKLEQNYRSHGNILDAANALINHNQRRLGKELWTDAGEGEPLRVYEAPTDVDEASFIVQEVRSLRGEGTRLSDIAMLYRSNAQSRVLEHALFNAGLAYRVYGGLRFFERQEIKHALAYLRLVASPDDDGAFLRVVNLPARGVGNRSIEQLQDIVRQRGVSLWQAACSNPPTGKAGQGVTAFIQLIDGLRQDCLGLSLPEMVELVIDRSGLKRYYESDRDGQDRIENLNELVNAAAGFDAEGGASIAEEDAAAVGLPQETAPAADPRLALLNAFLAHAALEAGEHQAADGAQALQLMTVHSAKGLEFDAVFVSGLEEGLFPHENSLNQADGVEEERRLMYVALTRARRRLYLSHAQTRMLHGQTRYNIASRFLGEIPERLVRQISPPRAQGWAGRSGTPAVHTITAYGAPSPSASPWRVGQDVLHPKFGPGVIVSVQGRGSDARVMVNFRQAGMKELALEYAKLTAA
ncbi:MAG TPA: UvrD-helicase domain-containing protein [Burkholderiales bacterium]|nr:UvrD-helicase domain-containing protein [Burkholderiales bacterium]